MYWGWALTHSMNILIASLREGGGRENYFA
jgi:hypothetical protein